MPLPRYKQINTDVTPYYHCISRCVRQSYLCGRDARTGINYEHRRKWIQDRLHKLSQAFAIDLCAYAVMRVSKKATAAYNAVLDFRRSSSLDN